MLDTAYPEIYQFQPEKYIDWKKGQCWESHSKSCNEKETGQRKFSNQAGFDL